MCHVYQGGMRGSGGRGHPSRDSGPPRVSFCILVGGCGIGLGAALCGIQFYGIFNNKPRE